MQNLNPYEAPTPVTAELERFTQDRLPIVFNVPANWRLYWTGMIVIAAIPIVLATLSLQSSSSSILTMAGVFAPFPIIFIAIWELASKVVITKTGIRVNRTMKEIEWPNIKSWSRNANSTITLQLSDDRLVRVIGSATSQSRNQVIEDAVCWFVDTDLKKSACQQIRI